MKEIRNGYQPTEELSRDAKPPMTSGEVAQKAQDDEDVVYALTPWGCLLCVLEEYGIDTRGITDKIGQHMVDDFMAIMEKSGNVRRVEENK